MTYDEWKATDPRDAEPDVEQVQCDECGGDGISEPCRESEPDVEAQWGHSWLPNAFGLFGGAIIVGLSRCRHCGLRSSHALMNSSWRCNACNGRGWVWVKP